MAFFKRYPIFCITLLVLLLVFGCGIYLAIGESGKLAQAMDRYDSDVRQIEQVSRGALYDEETGARITPTSDNTAILEARLFEVNEDLVQIRDDMLARSENILVPPADEFTFLPRLQSYISRMRSLAEDDVGLQPDEAFGFARYARIGDQPPIDKIPLLDHQRQVLEYILRQLIASQPEAILSVEREEVERVQPVDGSQANQGNQDPEDDVFTIEELVTARYNEFIDTFAFRLVFTGQTDVLRNFINRLADFELPLIVRSIEVRPAEEDDVPEEEEAANEDDNDPLAALFGTSFAEEEEEEVEESVPEDDREPVITETRSKFTIVIEFVELEIDMDDDETEAGA
ncbi:MAG: hypothetical protein AAGJ81_11565 [Verrucomicrobiota bacterium]